MQKILNSENLEFERNFFIKRSNFMESRILKRKLDCTKIFIVYSFSLYFHHFIFCPSELLVFHFIVKTLLLCNKPLTSIQLTKLDIASTSRIEITNSKSLYWKLLLHLKLFHSKLH